MGFLGRHRQWAFLITLAAATLLVAGAVSLTVVERVSKGPAFQAGAEFLRGNPIARRQLGVIEDFGRGVAGDVSDSAGTGTAHLSFDVHGSWRDGRAAVVARKEDGAWLITGATLWVGSRHFDLVGASTR